MKFTPHLVILLVGALGSIAAAWGGFLLGGGFHSSDFIPATQPMTGGYRPANAMASVAQSQPHKIPFSPASDYADATPDQSAQPLANAVSEVPPSAVVEVAPVSSNPAPSRNRRAPMSAARQAQPIYPVVMMDLPADILNAQPGLAATVTSLRDKFMEDVGGTNQNPADPAYHERWAQSVSSAEEQLKAAVGWEAYNSLQAAAYYAQQASSH